MPVLGLLAVLIASLIFAATIGIRIVREDARREVLDELRSSYQQIAPHREPERISQLAVSSGDTFARAWW